jgi:hypothetical protein
MSQEVTDSSTYESSPIGGPPGKSADELYSHDHDFNGQLNPNMTEAQENIRVSLPILKKDNKASLKSRKDSYGNFIRHMDKNHKIKFKNDISEVNEVENWKEYNVENKGCCSCKPF